MAYPNIAKVLALLCLFSCVSSAGEPLELTRLRDQYLRHVERQIEGPKQIYISELIKLEKRLGQSSRLEEALLIKKERERIEGPDSFAPNSSAPKNETELTKALENTTWSYIAEVPGKADVRFVILLPNNEIVYCWNNLRGHWKATGKNNIDLTYIASGNTYTGEMKIDKNLLKWEGSFSADSFARNGKRVTREP